MDFKSNDAYIRYIFLSNELKEELKALRDNLMPEGIYSYEGFSFNEDIPFTDELMGGFYEPPKFSINELVDNYSVSNIKCLRINGFLSNPKGIERFTNVEELSFYTDTYSYNDIKKVVGLDKTFFKVDLLWYPLLTQLQTERFENILNIENSKLTHLKVIDNRLVKQFLAIDFPNTLEYLEIAGFTKLKEFSVLKKVKNLKKIMFLASKNLLDLSAISDINTLEEIVFDECKNIGLDSLKSKSVKRLTIDIRGKKGVPSISFIKNLPNLEFIRITSNIEDKDLTPLVEHPNLKEIVGLHNHKYNYTLSEVLEMRTNGFIKEKSTMNNLSIFEEIDCNKLQEFYDTTIVVNNQTVTLDLTFEVSTLKPEVLEKAKIIIENIEKQNTNNLNYFKDNFTKEDSIVKEHINFCKEEFSEDLESCSEEDLLNKLELQRVGFYPNNEIEAFAVFDYCLGVSDELLVIRTDENGAILNIDTES